MNEVQLQLVIEVLANELIEFIGHERQVVSLNEYWFWGQGEHIIPFPTYPGLQWHS